MKETQNISKFYWGAIALMVLFTLAEFAFLEHFVNNRQYSAVLMDTSGHQRMLSQRIALYAEMMADAKEAETFNRAREKLVQNITQFESAHQKLTDPKNDLGKLLYSSPELRHIYFDEPINLNKKVLDYIEEARHISHMPPGESDDNEEHVRSLMYQSSSVILDVLDKAVAGYIALDQKTMRQLNHFSILFFLATFLCLGLVSLYLVRPMVKNIRDTLSMMNLLKSVATAANETSSVEEGLQAALNSICEFTKWPVGHAYIYSPEDKRLHSSNVWFMADCDYYASYRDASSKLSYGIGEGLIGRVYEKSTPEWILNQKQSDVCLRKNDALSVGLTSMYAFPVFIADQVVAVLEFYGLGGRAPDEGFLSLMNNIGKQLGQTIERDRARRHAQLLETVLASANDAIIITKADLANPGPEIIYVNDAFTKISGYQPNEVIGQSPRVLQGEFTKQETLMDISKALQAGRPFKGELLNYTKEHEPYWLDISIVPVKDAKGNITHFAALERDISQQKVAENQFKETMIQLKRANMKAEAATRDLQDSLRKAEEANKAKSDFLANMSHELRTPMNGVLGMAQLLKDTEMSEEQGNYVSTINGSAETLLMLLNDILDFSKIEAGALELEHIPYDVLECIHSSSNLLKPVADKKQVQLIVDNGSEISPFILGDSGRMRQILTNLIGNAIKFTEHGYVRVVTRLQHDGAETNLLIQVEDTGPGISNEKLATIFEKFTQGDASITRKYGGTGLGLAITKQLVSLMGGTIGVNSVEGKGSTFWLTLPYQPATLEDIEKQLKMNEAGKQTRRQLLPVHAAKVLLVEDYAVNQIFAEKLLRKFGFTNIDFAENGAQALVKYRHNHYDVIFMDCQMPEMDGYQATEHIRALEANTPMHTPIVAMTANAMMGDREKCLKVGMDDYVSKPLRIEHVRTVLKTFFVLDEEKNKISLMKNDPISTANPNDPPIDLNQLRLFTDGDRDEELSLFDLFVQQMEEMIIVLEQATDDLHKEKWKSAAHRFKGASGNIGATQLHLLCKAAEHGFDKEESNKQGMLERIRDESDRIKKFVANY